MAGSRSTKKLGAYYWASGPVCLGSAKLAAAVQARDSKLLSALQARAATPGVYRLLGEATVVFGGDNAPCRWLQGPDGGVLVRAQGHVTPSQLDTVLGYTPEQVPAGGWTLAALKLTLTGAAERCFLDPWAQHAAKKPPPPVAVSLAAGRWEIDHAVVGSPPLAAELFRFRRAGQVAVEPAEVKPTPGPPTLTLEPATQQAAHGLRFVESEGGPILVLPLAALPSWRGICNDRGQPVYGEEPTDYDRACAARGPILKLAGVEALLLDQESTAFFRASDEVSYLLRWIGADAGAHVLQAALSAPPSAWKSSRKTFTLASEGGVAIIDSAEYGPKLKRPARGDLAPGRYRIDVMTEFCGEILDKGGRHGLMASALRLRKQD